jgi:glutaredoxin
MSIIFYSTHCPRCKVLETKLKQKNVEYVECNDVEEMGKKGISSVPCLGVNEEIMDFGAAVKWVNALEV